MSSLIRDTRDSLCRPDHWLYAAWLSIVTGARKNLLGIFWVVFPPIVYVWGVGWFLGMLNPGRLRPFMAHVGVSFVLFRLIVTVINDCASTYRVHAPYINDGKVTYTDYVLSPLVKALILFVFAIPVLFVALLMSDQFTPLGIPMAFAGLLVVVFNIYFWGVAISILGAKLPDFSEFLANLTMMLFLLTPIVWYPSSVPDGSMQNLFMKANPLHHLIAIVRDPLVGVAIEPLTWIYVVSMTVIGVFAALFSYKSFAKRIPVWI